MITFYTKEGKFETLSIGKLPNNTIFHREDGPALIYSYGVKKWYKEGKLHRLGGPAVERKNHSKEWWVNNKLHRLDGPAYISNRVNIWYINDKKLNTKEVETWINNNNINLKTKQHQVLFMVKFW